MKAKEKILLDARVHMVESQIHPMGVVHEGVLKTFEETPREQFVPEGMGSICYCDEDIEVAPGRFLMEPSVLARMVQALLGQECGTDKVALLVGAGSGYNAAIMSPLFTTVVALEEDQTLLKDAQRAWDQLGCNNIAGVEGKLTAGYPGSAPYPFILIGGTVAQIPEEIKGQMAIGGVLVALVRPAGQGLAQAILMNRTDQDTFSQKALFEAGCPYLTGFEPEKQFVF